MQWEERTLRAGVFCAKNVVTVVDLFNDDLSRVPPADLYGALIGFLRIGDSVSDRPAEGWRLDFKREWNDRALQAVAGFANTFGGILIVGVDADTSDSSRPGSVFRTRVTHEVKLQIASAIATNISPTPFYKIGECADSTDAAKRIWIVQVRAGTSLHLLTKKDSKTPNPVYVRNESGNLPADAARLRALIAERIEAPKLPSDLAQRAGRMKSELFVTRKAETPGGSRPRSATYFLVSAFPNRSLLTRLDSTLEKLFQRIVETEFPKTSLTDIRCNTIAEYHEIITRDRYEFQILHPSIDFERRWTIRSNGDFGFASQPGRAGPNNEYFWSVADICIELIASLRAIHSYWRELDYFGEFVIVAYLGLNDLTLLRRSIYPAGLASVFYNKDTSMDTRVVSSPAALPPPALGVAEIEANTVEIEGNLAEVGTQILNQLLRCGGYSADFERMKNEVQHQIDFLAGWKNNPASFHISPHPSVAFLSTAKDAATS